jgi:hypothetical protein
LGQLGQEIGRLFFYLSNFFADAVSE